MFKNRIRCLGILLTRRCNLNCMYCYTDKGNDPSDILTLAEWKDVLTQARDMGCHWLSIAGSGEPMMDDRVIPLLEYARTLGLSCNLVTNGSFIDPENAAWFWK